MQKSGTALAPGLSELVLAARRGDAAATAALWARCNVIAKRIARRWVRDPADAEDISQEALLSAFKDLETVRDPNALAGWLHVVIVRAAKRTARYARQRQSNDATNSHLEKLEAHDAPPDSQVDCRRMLELVRRLPEEQRECLWLRRAEGLGIAEIAQETELSPATVYRRMDGAEARLARMVRDRRPIP